MYKERVDFIFEGKKLAKEEEKREKKQLIEASNCGIESLGHCLSKYGVKTNKVGPFIGLTMTRDTQIAHVKIFSTGNININFFFILVTILLKKHYLTIMLKYDSIMIFEKN
eukprot:Lithocolla_globosa_v1_NODE_8245_length_844_cov_50.718631.p1 type:complete len:111 gc:universal NODE_8245_length_844_cov_50.718631:724-392(-)